MERNMRTWTKLKRVRAKKKMKNPTKEKLNTMAKLTKNKYSYLG